MTRKAFVGCGRSRRGLHGVGKDRCHVFPRHASWPTPVREIAGSYRDGGAVKQQTLLSLGRLDVLQASGQLDALLRSGLRLSRRLVVLDAPAAGQTEAVVVKKIGPELVFGRLWEQTGIAAVLAGLLRERRYKFDVERAIYLTVLHRLFPTAKKILAQMQEDTLEQRRRQIARHHFEAERLDRIRNPSKYVGR